jgi:DNA polymerase-3 subunit epsilon
MQAPPRLIYYDTETTGVRSDSDRIIELAAYDPLLNKSFCQFIHPQMPIPKDSTAIHGITDDMVAQAPTFAVVGQAFFEFCGENAVLVAHNNDAFDKHFLSAEAARFGLTLPSWQMVDSLKWARKYRPDLPKHSLQYLRQLFGIKENQAHRALDDVMVLYEIFSILIDDLDVATVLRLMKEGSQVAADIMPFGKYQGKPISEVPADYLKWLEKQGAFDKPEHAALKEALENLKKQMAVIAPSS